MWIVDGTDPLGHPLTAGDVKAQYDRALDAFKRAGAENALHIVDRKPDQPLADLLRTWGQSMPAQRQ